MTTVAFVPLLPLADLAPGSKKTVKHQGRSILICNVNGQFFAVSNICSHAYERLECGRMSNSWISCPIHGARFDLATGEAKNPPAKSPIPVYDVRVVEGWIEVKL